MNILLTLLIPLLTGLLCLFTSNRKWLGRIQVMGMLALLLSTAMVLKDILGHGSLLLFQNFFHLDALAGLLLLVIAVVSFLVSLYSIDYIFRKRETVHDETDEDKKDHPSLKPRLYYVLMNLFIATLILLVSANSLGVFWIGVEASTLISAFMVGFENKEASVEAAWKYIILCTVGLAFALIGLIICNYAVIQVAPQIELSSMEAAMDWSYLMTIASRLDPNLMKIAFIFIMIGYGTKAGLAPMHSWLPDTYSEAPSPISAHIAGVLSKCAIYGIIRFGILVNQSVDPQFSGSFLMTFGLISLVIATPFILTQRNIKRLLAYSSLEHIGIISVGLGFGTPLAVFGALFHLLNHALTKTLMFFTAGNMVNAYHTKSIPNIRGIFQKVPLSGAALILGTFALAGSPPFSLFNSEFMVLSGGFTDGHKWEVLLFITLMAVIFAGLLYQVIQMATSPREESVCVESAAGFFNSEGQSANYVAMVIPLMILLVLAWWIPHPLSEMLKQSVQIITGRSVE